MSHIFVSYATKDATDIAIALVTALEARGQPCWLAPRDMRAGEDYPAQIVRAIRTCRGLVVLLTPGANASTDVLQEVQGAHDERKPIYPVIVHGTRLGDGLSYFLKVRQQTAWTEANATAVALRAAFDPTTGATGSAGSTPPQAPVAGSAWRRPSPLVWTAAASALLAGLVVSVAYTLGGGAGRQSAQQPLVAAPPAHAAVSSAAVGYTLAHRFGQHLSANSNSQTSQAIPPLAPGFRGWILAGGLIFSTHDGGQTWTSHNPEAGDGSMYFADDMHGWVVGGSTRGLIGITVDGGDTWTTHNIGLRSPKSVCFADAKTGWVSGFAGTVIATTDGGSSWVPQFTTDSNRPDSLVDYVDDLYLACARDGRRVWAVGGQHGGDGVIATTSDGGKSWRLRHPPHADALTAVYFDAAGRHGWAVGERGTVIATVDGGVTWHPQVSGAIRTLQSVHFSADGRRGLAVGDETTLLVTHDGGENWSPRSTPYVDAGFLSAYMAKDGKHGWVAGDHGVIVTTDGGDTWTELPGSPWGLGAVIHFWE